MFRFAATANTNGGGDETGLYQGTQRQNLTWGQWKTSGQTLHLDAPQCADCDPVLELLNRAQKKLREGYTLDRTATSIPVENRYAYASTVRHHHSGQSFGFEPGHFPVVSTEKIDVGRFRQRGAAP